MYDHVTQAELLAAEAEIEKLEKQENENDEEELVDETKTSSENVEDTAEEVRLLIPFDIATSTSLAGNTVVYQVQSGSVPNRKPPAFHIANVFRRVAGDIQVMSLRFISSLATSRKRRNRMCRRLDRSVENSCPKICLLL